MAIATTIKDGNIFSMGNRKCVIGQSVMSGGSSQENVGVPLKWVDDFQVQVTGGTQKGHSVNEVFPLYNTPITVKCESNDLTILWMAIGR